MSDFFMQVGDGLGEAVERQCHLPWHARVRAARRRNLVIGLVAALAVATPAVAAATHYWFASGAPDRFPMSSPSQLSGHQQPGTISQLLALRVSDPQGGPPWGIRVLRTTRGDTCLQIGRVQDNQIGSLGIDGAWSNDHLFHAFPKNAVTGDCATTDGAGHAFLNSSLVALPSSAEPTVGASGAQARSCRPGNQAHRPQAVCPPGTMRIVYAGLLGPDAQSIRYRSPDGSVKTQPTTGPDGAYLLVFTRDARSCSRYGWGDPTELASCVGDSVGGANPPIPGPIAEINYRSHSSCVLSASLERGSPLSPTRCPAVGYVPNLTPHITHAQLATPIAVHLIRGRRWCLPRGSERGNSFNWAVCDSRVPDGDKRIDVYPHQPIDPATLADISWTARVAVTSSRSWYEVFISSPRHCVPTGTGAEVGFGNIRAGETLRFGNLQADRCPGIYRGTVGYGQATMPVPAGFAGGGEPGRDGSTIVGRFSYVVRPPGDQAGQQPTSRPR